MSAKSATSLGTGRSTGTAPVSASSTPARWGFGCPSPCRSGSPHTVQKASRWRFGLPTASSRIPRTGTSPSHTRARSPCSSMAPCSTTVNQPTPHERSPPRGPALLALHLGPYGPVAGTEEELEFSAKTTLVPEERRLIEQHRSHLVELNDLDRPYVTERIIPSGHDDQYPRRGEGLTRRIPRNGSVDVPVLTVRARHSPRTRDLRLRSRTLNAAVISGHARLGNYARFVYVGDGSDHGVAGLAPNRRAGVEGSLGQRGTRLRDHSV